MSSIWNYHSFFCLFTHSLILLFFFPTKYMTLDGILERSLMVWKNVIDTVINVMQCVNLSVAGITYITSHKRKVKIWWEEATHKISVYDSN